MRISDWSSDVCSSDLALAVIDLDDIAVTRAAADERHAARRGGEDGGAARAGEIQPRMHRAGAGEGVMTIAVAGRKHQHMRGLARGNRDQRAFEHFHADRKSTRLNSSH